MMRTFSSREAAILVAARLRARVGNHALVLAHCRNEMPFARSLAEELHAEFDITLTQELRAEACPSCSIAAISENGEIFWRPCSCNPGFSEEELAHRILRGLEALLERRRRYTSARPPADPSGRTTIVALYGLASGSSVVAALQAARARRPGRLIAAMAAATPEALRRIRQEADEVVCLESVGSYSAVARSLGGAVPVPEARAIEILHDFDAAWPERHS